jgi:hypothetical protein
MNPLRALLFAGLACAASLSAADPPPGIIALFRAAAEELAEQDAPAFLDHFDTAMPGYAQLKADIEGLLVRGYIVSTIEFVSDEGDEQARELVVDWLWRLSGSAPKRVIVKCRTELQGRVWRITRLDPLDMFRTPAA